MTVSRTDLLMIHHVGRFLSPGLIRNLRRRTFTFIPGAVCALGALAAPAAVHSSAAKPVAAHPNILLIYADDLGWGDVGCYGATAVKTPNIDRLAREGLRFTSSYAAAATCTPSRYSLLTGEYPFRQPGTGVLPGDAAMIVKPGRPTLASELRRAGYTTAVVGKWHLGLGSIESPVEWNREIRPGPLDVGFDYAFIMAATGDRVPCVYIENRRVVGLDPSDPLEVSYEHPFPGQPSGAANREQLVMDWSHSHNEAVVNGIGRIGWVRGGKSAQWHDETMADTFTAKAVAFLEQKPDRPFFLYFATHDIHVPRVPHPRFVGATGMGPRGDVIAQLDWCVGTILAALERRGLAENTMVIFTSDNGPVVDDGYKDGAVEKLGSHRPGGPHRGGKYSLLEAGTRVPLIVRWPGRVPAGRVSDALISQVDFPASLCSLAGREFPRAEAPDTRNLLPALLGDSSTGADSVIQSLIQGSRVRRALRQHEWKFIPPNPGPALNPRKPVETGASDDPQLYDLSSDPGETPNLAALPEHAGRVARLSELLGSIASPQPTAMTAGAKTVNVADFRNSGGNRCPAGNRRNRRCPRRSV